MSKKDKLKKQHAAQLERKRLDEQEEQREKQRAKGRQSMAAKRMRRAARRGYVGAVIVILTILMTISYIYSGIVFGLVITVYGSLSGQAELIPHSVAYAMLIGDALMLAGLVLSFRGKKIMQGLFCLPGSASFLWGALAVIKDLKARLAQPGTDPSLSGMDRTYMWYYLPILLLTVLSAAIFVYGIVSYAAMKRRERISRDNAPVKSIVDK